MLFWSYVENLLYRPLKGVFYKGAEQNPRASIISSAEHFSIHAIEVFEAETVSAPPRRARKIVGAVARRSYAG